MDIEDLILVSIDDTLLYRPTCSCGTSRPSTNPEATIVLTDGVDRWVYQRRRQGVNGLNAVVSWPAEDSAAATRRLRRDASRRLRRP